MNNKPVAWMHKKSGQVFVGIGSPTTPNDFTPLYTHPANELAEDLEGAKLVILRLNDMLRQQQAEIEALKMEIHSLTYGERLAEYLKKAQEK